MLYEIPKHSKKCASTGREIAPGEAYFSALIEGPIGFERRDYAPEGWTGPPEGTIGFWQGQLASEQKPVAPKAASIDDMVSLFHQIRQTPEARAGLLFVLALLLIRRRALKLHGSESGPNGRELLVSFAKDSDVMRIADPGLDEAGIASMETELAVLLQQVVN